MIVVTCSAPLYPKAYNGVLYFDPHTLSATTHELAMVFTSIALERGFDAMVDAQTLAFQVMQGAAGNASLISKQCSKVLDLMVFHLQNVEETYTIA
jgi:hypothetical protein